MKKTLVMSVLAMSMGVTAFAAGSLATVPDAGVTVTSKGLKISLGNARLLDEFLAIGLGAGLLGGPFGVATFVLSFFLGYLIQYFYKMLEVKYPIQVNSKSLQTKEQQA